MHYQKIGLLFIIAVAIIVSFSCALTFTNGGKIQPSSIETPTPQYQTTIHHLPGQVISVGDTWDIVVNGVSTSKKDPFSQLGIGDVYLLVDMTFTNISGKTQDLSSFSLLKLRGTDGTNYEKVMFGPNQGELNGKIAPGEVARSTIPFKVPQNVKKFTLNYAENDRVVVWDLNI